MPTYMPNEYGSFDFSGKPVIEHLVFYPPLSKIRLMQEEACFLYQVKANNRLYAASQNIQLGSQEAVVMKCGNYISKYFTLDTPGPSEVVVRHFYPEMLREIYKNDLPAFMQGKGDSSGILIRNVDVDAIIQGYIKSILFYFRNPSIVTGELILLKVKELILLLARTEENSKKIKLIFQELFSPSRINFSEIVESNLYEDLSLQELASLCHMSLASFHRKFKEIFEESPANYFRKEKIEKSKRLLAGTKMRINEVAWECGFGTISHFSKVFKRQTGVTPKRFRILSATQ